MNLLKDYRIVISENSTVNEKRAASFIQANIKLIVGKKLKIVYDNTTPLSKEIVVGYTSREAYDGYNIKRSKEGASEFILKMLGKRLYITGLGVKDPDATKGFTSSYRYIDEGDMGTVYGAYYFVEEILKYDFLNSTFVSFTENPKLALPDDYEYEYTRHALRSVEIPIYSDTAMYMIPLTAKLEWNIMSFVFRTKEGKLVVIDGGEIEETENFLNVLQQLTTNDETPVVSAWLLTHLHSDHFGVYYNIVKNYDKYRDMIKIENFYCNLLEEEFYTTLSREACLYLKNVRDVILGSGDVLGCRIHTVMTGDIINIDDLSFKVLHIPSMEYAKKMNINDSGVIYKLTVADKQTVMFLGDAEFVCENDLMANHKDELKSDVVQVGHHGCGNVSKKCYEAIGADIYLWPAGKKFWYSDMGEGLNTHNTGVIRTRYWLCQLGAKKQNIYSDTSGLLSFEFPIPIK